MLAYPHDQSSNLINDLKSYIDPSAQLLVALETCKKSHIQTKGQHYHIIVNPMTEKQYDAYRKSILVNKYKLSGQAKDGKPRAYGRVKDIRDQTKIISYTLKDKNIYFENYDLKTIQDYIEKSFPRKQKPKDFVSSLMEYLVKKDSTFYEHDAHPQYSRIEKSILQYYISENIGTPVSKTTLRSLTTRYLMYHAHVELDTIYFYIHSH